MVNKSLKPRIQVIADGTGTSATVTSTTSYTFDAPIADSYSLILITGTGTGTSPTMDASLQFSIDGGTTYIPAPVRFPQQTTTGLTEYVTFRIGLGQNEVALATSAAATGGTLAKNFVPASMKWRLTCTLAGTSPSYATIKAYLTALA